MLKYESEKLEISKDNLICMLERVSDFIKAGKIEKSVAIEIMYELTNQSEEPENEVDEIVYNWSYCIEEGISSYRIVKNKKYA